MEIAARLAANVLRCREAAGLSQEQLGYLAGLHRTEISQVERGLRVIRVDTLVKLCAALEVESATLLDGIAWRPPPLNYGGFAVSEG